MSTHSDDQPRRDDGATIRSSEEHYRLLVESVRDDAIFMLDPSARVATWNLGAERIKGYRRDEILDQPYKVFLIDEDVADARASRLLEQARLHRRAR